jgi:SAM-dependent methyltransferase
VQTEPLFAPSDCEIVACDLCGSTRSRPFMASNDRAWPIHSNTPDLPAPAHVWTTVRCTSCGLVYLSPRPTPEALPAAYPTSYYAYASEATPPQVTGGGWKAVIKRALRRNKRLYELAQRTRFADSIADAITQSAGWVPPGRVLDVGCGTGTDLDTFKELGWTTFGFDFSEDAVRHTTARGHTVWHGDVTTLDVAERDMDAVYMSHILEHVGSPFRTLEAVGRLLRPGGILVIESPNIGPIWSAVFRERSSSVDLPRHFYHFTGQTLEKMLVKSGFMVRSIRTEANPRFLLRSITLSLRDWAEDVEPLRGGAPVRSVPETTELMQTLKPFCRAIETMDQGNNLIAIAQKPA